MSSPTPNQSRIIWAALTFAAVALMLACLAGGVWALGRVLHLLGPVLWPLAVAGVLAYLLDPVVDWLERRQWKRQRAILAVFALAALVMLAVGGAVIPRLVVETRDLAVKVPDYARQLQHRVEKWIESKPQWDIPFLKSRAGATTPATNAVAEAAGGATTNALVTRFESAAGAKPAVFDLESLLSHVPKMLPALGRGLADQVSRVAAFFGLLAGLALVPVYCFYFLLEKQGIRKHWTDYLPVSESRVKEEIVFVLNAINDRLIVFFRGQVLVAACDGAIYALGFMLMGLNYGFLLGFAAVFLTIIPFLGAIIIFVTAFLLALVQFQDWQHPAMVVGVFAVVQTLEGLVISPKIIGDPVGLHPLTIIIAVMVGTTLLGGLLGGLLAIPVTAALRELMFRYVWKQPAA